MSVITVVPEEYRIYAQNAALLGQSQHSAWYGMIGSASGYTPADADDNTDISSSITEITGYVGSTRVAFTPNATPTTTSAVSNTSSPMVFENNSGGSLSIYAVALSSESTKSGTSSSHVLANTSKLSAAKTLDDDGDQLSVKMTITMTDES
jgi:hypothetical protein